MIGLMSFRVLDVLHAHQNTAMLFDALRNAYVYHLTIATTCTSIPSCKLSITLSSDVLSLSNICTHETIKIYRDENIPMIALWFLSQGTTTYHYFD